MKNQGLYVYIAVIILAFIFLHSTRSHYWWWPFSSSSSANTAGVNSITAGAAKAYCGTNRKAFCYGGTNASKNLSTALLVKGGKVRCEEWMNSNCPK